MSKILDVYQAIVGLAHEGQADVKQETVAQVAGVSVRHMHRLIEGLRDVGLLEFYPLHDRLGHRRKTRFILKSLNDSGSHLGQKPNGHPESVRLGLTDSWSHLGEPNGLPESEHDLKHDHDMNGDDIFKFLDFFSEPARSFCASKLSRGEAEAWQQFKDFNDIHQLWEARGITKNPVGWIFHMITTGQAPPALQIPMPGGSFEAEPFASRGMTREEIQQSVSPTDGAVIGDDGIWR